MLIREYLNQPRHSVFRSENFVFSHFARMPDAAQLKALESALKDAYASHPTQLVTIHIMDPEGLDVKRDVEMRQIMTDFTKEYSGKLHTAALIVISRGFGTALLRSIVAGVLAIVPRKAPTKVCSSVDEACQWVASRFPQMPDTPAVLRALAEKAVRPELTTP